MAEILLINVQTKYCNIYIAYSVALPFNCVVKFSVEINNATLSIHPLSIGTNCRISSYEIHRMNYPYQYNNYTHIKSNDILKIN